MTQNTNSSKASIAALVTLVKPAVLKFFMDKQPGRYEQLMDASGHDNIESFLSDNPVAFFSQNSQFNDVRNVVFNKLSQISNHKTDWKDLYKAKSTTQPSPSILKAAKCKSPMTQEGHMRYTVYILDAKTSIRKVAEGQQRPTNRYYEMISSNEKHAKTLENMDRTWALLEINALKAAL